MPCTTEKKSFLDSYEVEIEKIKKDNPSLSSHEVRLLGAQLWRPKFHEWKTAAAIEEKGAADYENGEFAIDAEGKMYFPKTGEYAEGLHENQRLLSQIHNNPDEYSNEDYERTLLIQSSFKDGATRVVTSFTRSDGKNRDVLEYRYDRVANKGSIRVINTESGGNYKTAREIKELAREKFSDLREVEPVRGVFIFTDTPVSVRVARDTAQTIQYAGARVGQEVKQTVASVRRHIDARKVESARNTKQETVSPVVKIHKKRTLFQTIREKVLSVKKQTGNTHAEKPLRAPQKTSIAERLTIPVTGFAAERRIEKSIVRHERNMLKRKMRKEVRSKPRIKTETHPVSNVIRLRSVEQKGQRTKRKSGVVERVLFSKRKLKKEMVRTSRAEKRKDRKKRTEQVVGLFILAKKLIQVRERLFIRKQNKKEKKYLLKTKEKQKPISEKREKRQESVINFSIAFIFWIFMENHKNVFLHEYKRSTKEHKILHTKETAPWVLLAIIWHLAMIREQGHTQQQQKKKKAKVNTFSPQFAPQGVIFAFAT